MIEWLMHLPVWIQALFATLFTWFMTAFGAAFVFISGKFNTKALNVMQGTAAGIMIAASFFSLLLPAAERLESSGNPATTALILSAGFLLGCAFILLSDFSMSRMKIFSQDNLRSGALACFAITLHNIPEGFAVGVAFGSLAGDFNSSCWLLG